jgi:hypothetical protein
VDEGHVHVGRPGIIGIAAVCSGPPPELAALRARVAERWHGLPRMSWTLRPRPRLPGPRRPAPLLAGHRWAAAASAFDAARHVLAADEKLEPLLRTGVAQPLPEDLPLWRLWLTEDVSFGGDFAVVLFAHHALLDGRSLETLIRLLMDDPPPPRNRSTRHARPAPPPPVRVRAARRELLRTRVRGQALPLASPPDAEPSVAVTALSPRLVEAARRQPADGPGATLNELLLGSLAGALRDRYGPISRWPEAPAPIHATVPVDLRSRVGAYELGNFVSVLRLPLPLDQDSPVDRLRVCRELAAAFPARSDVHRRAFPLLEASARLGPWAPVLVARHLVRPDIRPTVCTAFKWRDGASALHGRRLVRIVPLPQLSGPGTANLCLTQTGDAYTLTVVSHHRPGEAGALSDAVTRELERLATPS